MPSGRSEVSFFLRRGLHDVNEEGWLFVPLSVGPDIVLEMIPNPTAPRSSIGRRTLNNLRALGLLEGDGSTFILRDLRIIGQPVPDLTVRVGPAATLLGVDGILGLDFFGQYSAVIFEPLTHRVTLIAP